MTNKPILLNGDCLELMKQIPDNYLDSCVSDAPYGLSKQPDIAEVMQHWLNDKAYEHKSTGFMGKSWDSFVPGPEYWREVYRVLKPGGHAAIFAGSRTQDLMSIALRFAGFEIRETVMWVYGSGMPKSLAVDKAIGKLSPIQHRLEEFAALLKQRRTELGLTLSQADKEITNGSTMYSFLEGRNLNGKASLYKPNKDHYANIKRLYGIDGYDDIVADTLSVVGSEDGSFGYQKDGERWIKEREIKETTTDQAKQWQGWGTALKPAYEPIILVRKPLEGTVAQNVLKWGVGGINIDECRVELANESDKAQFEFNHAVGTRLPEEYADKKLGLHDGGWMQQVGEKETPTGRWPANLCHDGSDEVVEMFPESKGQQGDLKEHSKERQSPNGTFGKFAPAADHAARGDSGSAARFFYSSKATKKDRGEGNTHPTVKPVRLMEWLVKMITPANGKCLDPFMGSGTTGVACINTSRRFIGMEMDEGYFQIAKNRLQQIE